VSGEKLEGWGIVELMGHQRTAGRLSERSIAGSNLLQVDVPVTETEFRTVFYGGSAIYALHPTDEASARLMGRSLGQRPVYSYELERQARLEAPRPAPPGAPSPPDPLDLDDDDSDDDEREYGSEG
jgi:hypothetical protein